MREFKKGPLDDGWYFTLKDIENGMTEPKGPVQIVCRKEVTPGRYGQVVVTEDYGVFCHTLVTAEELREAAHIFNQIAEAWEDVE